MVLDGCVREQRNFSEMFQKCGVTTVGHGQWAIKIVGQVEITLIMYRGVSPDDTLRSFVCTFHNVF